MIKQGSEEWLKAKQARIGGSEIYAIAYYYCQKELQTIGVDLIKDQPFQTALELFLRVKFGVDQEAISVVSSEFGSGMEDYVLTIYVLF